MAILAFQKPDKVLMLEADNNFGKFEFRPLEPGYGVTIGNALRRILLSSLEGFAICNIRGVREDVTNIILNLKKVRLKQVVEETETEKATIKVAGQEVFKAGDIANVLSGFEVLNPDLVICNLDPQANFQMDITINKGRGYMSAEENRSPNDPIDVIAIDSIYTPIVNVKYEVDNYRVEQKTDYEKLILEITTDGSIQPKDALKDAAKILIQHFMLFSDEKIALDTTENNGEEEFDEEVLKMRQLLKTKLVDMSLSVRALNCLKSAEVETLAELVVFNKTDLLKFRNFGKKSLSELEELLDILSSAIGSLTNPEKLKNTFRSVKKSNITSSTIKKYLDYLEDSFLVESSKRYDIRGKKYIETPQKYYFSDLGLRNARLNFRQIEQTHSMENVIYNELRHRGYNVDVGVVTVAEKDENGSIRRKALEVDFVCNLGSEQVYIQSAFSIPDAEKRRQEIRPFRKIDDSFRKIIVTKDIVPMQYDDYGILTMNVYDFLLNKEILRQGL